MSKYKLDEGFHKTREPAEDVKIARELRYPKSVQDKLAAEPDELKRSRILTNARLGIY